ncbi:hypothetical protein BCV72DRAFT_309879 [Rhizopus microsporus var. microsporus]|nr:hypothetical protein BCV72DRAFT_309879 [Rhizopus microsporus var. microsporus]
MLESSSLEGNSNNKDANGNDDGANMDKEEEADSEEETEPVVDQLYKLYFKKFNKQEFDDEENTFLKQMVKRKSCIKGKVLGLASKLLLKKNTDVQDDMMLKLSLSIIVNTIQPDSYDILKKVFTKKEIEAIENISLDLYVGLSEEDEKPLYSALVFLKKAIKSMTCELDSLLRRAECYYTVFSTSNVA